MTSPPEIDILSYKTSSSSVHNNFSEFNWIILAGFLDAESAYDHEHYLINESWDNPLLINESCYHRKRRFKNSQSSMAKSKETLFKNHGVNNPGQTTQSKLAASDRFKSSKNPAYNQSESTRAKISATANSNMADLSADEKSLKFGSFGHENQFFGKHHSDETKAKISEKVSTAWKKAKKIWMHDINLKNYRVSEVDIDEELSKGSLKGYAPGTHPNNFRKSRHIEQ